MSTSAFAQTLQPVSTVVEEGTGLLVVGEYARTSVQDDHITEKLVKTVSSPYNEVVVRYENVLPGNYQYRFARIPKSGVTLSNWSSGGQGGCIDAIRQALFTLVKDVDHQVERFQVVSQAGSETAEIRLSAMPPEETVSIYNGGVLAIACSDVSLAQRAAWSATPRPNTEWRPLTVKTANALVFRYPEDVSDARFELVKVN